MNTQVHGLTRAAIGVLVVVLTQAVSLHATNVGVGTVDFRYAPPWWQTAICLPDDPEKTVVGKEGQVLLDFKGRELRNFGTIVQPDLANGTNWLRQQTLSARTPIVQTWKEAGGVSVLEETFVVVPGAGERQTTRRIVVLVTLENATTATATRQPLLRIQSLDPLNFKDNSMVIGEQTRISSSDPILSCTADTDKTFIALSAPVTLQPGDTHQTAFVIERNSPTEARATSTSDAVWLRDAARDWWETKSGLPFTTIQVPDAGIQSTLESSVRNIWQAREIKNGLPAFHVGPTVYRGLWVVDGAFLLESAALLGRAQDARAGIDYLLSRQKPDGSFEIIKHFWKENGIVLWTVVRHALLTQDKAWLQARWPALQRVVKAVQNLRAQTLDDPQALNYGLLPGGFVDGGIDHERRGEVKGAPEYSNIYWTLAGLKAVITAAQWLGDDASAATWQRDFDSMLAAFRKAAARDTLKDNQGNVYLPTMMANAGNYTPQKGQWAFCHAVYPGQVFPVGDPFIAGQLSMLRATKVEGMVFDTGWMKDGLWTYFASFYGHALLWEGHRREASDLLYAFANHASPTRVWREEQKPLGNGAEEVGDMPHNWASAEFIRLATHLIELDRGDELHLLEGFPGEWAGPGMVTRLNGVATPFGPVQFEVSMSGDGRSARVKLGELEGRRPAKIVLHLNALTGQVETVELPSDRNVDQTFTR